MSPSDSQSDPRAAFRLPRLAVAAAISLGLPRCLDDLLDMPPPLPRPEMAGSPIGCSPATQRPSPTGRRVGSGKTLSGPAQGSLTLRPADLPLDYFQGSAEASAGRLPAAAAPVATGAYRQFPGRDLHPLAIETSAIHSSCFVVQSIVNLLTCRTAWPVSEQWAFQGARRTPSRRFRSARETSNNLQKSLTGCPKPLSGLHHHLPTAKTRPPEHTSPVPSHPWARSSAPRAPSCAVFRFARDPPIAPPYST